MQLQEWTALSRPTLNDAVREIGTVTATSARQAVDAGGVVAAEVKDTASEVGAAVRDRAGNLRSGMADRASGLRDRIWRKS